MQIKKIFWRKRVRLKLYFSMHAHPSICNFEFPFQSFKFLQKTIFDFRAVEKGGGGQRAPASFPPPPTVSRSKSFFPRLHANNMWDFIYWTRHKWQKVDSFFWICCFSIKLSYNSYQQKVCKFSFLKRIFAKTNRNLMCDSL